MVNTSDICSRHQDIMGVLEDIAEESLQATRFFHGGPARNDVGWVCGTDTR